jgi:transposase-like protein
MKTSEFTPAACRSNRRHSAEFKAEVIAACLQPDVSIASVALTNQLNANFLRGLVKAYRDQQLAGAPTTMNIEQCNEPASCSPPTLVHITLQAPDVQSSGDIHISGIVKPVPALSQRRHGDTDSPSTISLKQASTIAEICTQ